MRPTLALVRDTMTPTLTKYVAVMGRGAAETLKRAFRGVTRRVTAFTPPGSAGVSGAQAKRAGETRIKRQMSALFAPKRLKGKRVINKVFGRSVSPVTVPTRELHPNVASLYKQNLKQGAGRGPRLKNFRGRKFFVDQRKFQAELKRRQANVGRMASGWNAAVNVAGLTVLGWIARHGSSRGTANGNLITSRMRMTAINIAPGVAADVRAEMARRIPYALEYQREAMRREIVFMVHKNAMALAIKTRNFAGVVPAGMYGGDVIDI